MAPSSSSIPKDGLPRQVFLHARCSRTKKPYLMRYSRQGQAKRYEAIAAHPLEVLEEGDSLPPVSSSLLDGCPSCPYCENPVASLCSCGTIFCNVREPTGPVICPGCGTRTDLRLRGRFRDPSIRGLILRKGDLAYVLSFTGHSITRPNQQ